ncbi:MAG: preprotein translocase subunit SecG [Candidatus Omnitrophica bacterium]|nr:preprotein translocase subunit SecG [Candidatus Omnitrophota bacterium]
MTIIIIVLHILACFTLIAVILLQAGRGHGLAGSSFGAGGPVQSIFGTKTADVLSKATTVMAICFIVTCISLDIIQAHKGRSLLARGKKAETQVDLEQLKEAMKKIQETKKEPAGEAQKQETPGSGGETSPQNQPTVQTEVQAKAPESTLQEPAPKPESEQKPSPDSAPK